MTDQPTRFDCLLLALTRGASDRLKSWLEAAIAERSIAPAGLPRLEWTLGLIAILGSHLMLRVLAPWTRRKGEGRPDGLAAALGGALLVPALAAAVLGWTGLDGLAGYAVVGGLLLALWVNLGVVLSSQHLGGLTYAVGLRRLPTNLLLIAGGGGLGVALLRGLSLHLLL